MTKTSRHILIVITVLLLALLACNTLLGGSISVSTEQPATEAPIGDGGDGGTAPTEPPIELPTQPPVEAPTKPPIGGGGGGNFNTEFPLPDDVSSFIDLGDGQINFQTGMSLSDTMAFYRDAFGKEGYTERELLTVTSDSTFSMVFDGHASGKSVVIQGVDLGGSTNVNIRLEAVP